MQIKWLMVAFLLFWGSAAQACDVCGCAASLSLGNIGLAQNRSFVGFQSQYLAFHAWDHQGDQARDEFFQVDLRARLFFLKRLSLEASLPYSFRFRDYQETPRRLQGPGDPWLRLDVELLNAVIGEDENIWHSLSLGAGIKAPLGTFQPEWAEDGLSPLPANFQLGTGSWDQLFMLVYRLQSGKWGTQVQAQSRINRPNERLYRFGHQLGVNLLAYRWLSLGAQQLRLMGGGYAELIGQDTQFGLLRDGTGGKGLFLLGGAEYYIRNMVINITVNLPVIQEYSNQEVAARSRAGAGISYLF
jgi:hypothetical protein